MGVGGGGIFQMCAICFDGLNVNKNPLSYGLKDKKHPAVSILSIRTCQIEILDPNVGKQWILKCGV